MDKNMLYRSIPKVDVLLADEKVQMLIETYSRETVMESIHLEMNRLRAYIAKCEDEEEAKRQIEALTEKIERTVSAMHTPNMRMVMNGTGTILHTNLGRAPISPEHMKRVAAIATGYSNLEYNLEAGRRGERYSHFEELLCKITGAEAAMAVNNNAASVMLILSSLAKGGEVIVSRGELVEIGGKFRIPDVMEQSGASLVEVGTTNKTHYDDYEDAITKGADVVCFSGDKLLGGPQAGIIIGKKKYIDMMKKNQLTRALRIDKFTAATLELVLQEYLSEEKAVQNIPVLRMITKSLDEVTKDAKKLCRILKAAKLSAEISVVPLESQIGGGSLPLERIASMGVAINPEKISITELEERLRHMPVPLIPRTANDTVLIDVRTMDEQNFKLLAKQLQELQVFEEKSLIEVR